MAKQRVGLILCEIFFREAAWLAAQCEDILDLVILPKGLHDLGGQEMRGTLQAEIDKMDAQTGEKRYSRILLGYGLCNNGIIGLSAKNTPMVIPKAHDCITLFMGCRQRYREYFDANPGTYYHTTGWLARGEGGQEFFDSRL